MLGHPTNPPPAPPQEFHQARLNVRAHLYSSRGSYHSSFQTQMFRRNGRAIRHRLI